jgi:hypothetical protein
MWLLSSIHTNNCTQFIQNYTCKLDVLVLYAFVLYLPDIRDLSPKHAGEFMCLGDLLR